jgi:endoglucanase
VRYQFGYIPTGQFDPARLRFLKRHIRLFTTQGLWVIPNVHTFQLADHPDSENVWNAPRLRQEFLDMWDYILGELKDEPFIAAWEPINEPHYVDREKLTPWYRDVVAHFRTQDARTPLVIEGANYSGAEELLDALKLDDTNLIYSFHFYHPHEYTHRRSFNGRPPAEYPGKWGRAALVERLSTAIRFRDRYQVPVLCGEWGVQTGAVGYQQWLKDTSSLLEENHIPWMHWAWAGQRRWPVNDTFDCNTEKTEIHDLLRDVFKQALSPATTKTPSAKSRPSPQDH